MARVSTSNTSYSIADETALEVPGTVWYLLEPNDVSTFGPVVETISRNPISKGRQRKKGSPTRITSDVEMEFDVTYAHMLLFAPKILLSTLQGARIFVPSACDTDSFTVTANGAALAQNDLIRVRGAVNPVNNGLHVVGAAATTTDIPVGTTLVTETLPANARVELCGIRTASGDLDVDASGNLTATSLDFTTLPLHVGQVISVGGDAATNRFTNVLNRGTARITAIAAGVLTLDNSAFVTEANTTQLVDIYFGPYVEHVNADDAEYDETTSHIEALWTDLDNPAADMYEYSKGNYMNSLDLSMSEGDKATMSVGWLGTDTDPPTTSRATGASTGLAPNANTMYNCGSDLGVLRVTQYDDTGLTTCFTDLTLTITNNRTPFYCMGKLGADAVDVGDLEVDMSSTIQFDNAGVLAAIRNNETVSAEIYLKNIDGGIIFDIPAATLSNGARSLNENSAVTATLDTAAHEDDTTGKSVTISFLPYVPVYV